MSPRFFARLAAAAAVVLLAASCNEPSSDEPTVESSARPDAAAQKEILDSLERLRAEMSAIRRLLERGAAPAGAGASPAAGMPATGSAPLTETDWADLERAAEARIVIDAATRHRARLLAELLTAEEDAAAGPQPVQVQTIENGVAVTRTETTDGDALNDEVEMRKKALSALSRVRSIDDLARWRKEFQVEPLE